MLAERLKIPEIANSYKIKITSDVDGVVTCPAVVVLKYINRRFGTDYKIGDIGDWNSTLYWAKDQGMSDAEALAIHRFFWYESPDLVHRHAPAVPGAVSLIRKLTKSPRIELTFPSARPSLEFEATTYSWFGEFMPFVKPEQISLGEKIKKIKEIKPLFHLEDSVDDAIKIVENTEIRVILVPYAYNYGKLKHERIFEYDPEEVNLNFMPTLWPIYRLFKELKLF